MICHLVPKPTAITIIGTMWVFLNKQYDQCMIIIKKGTVMVQGYNQEEGINYDETFSPIARMEAIRILIALASYMDFKLFQMDVNSSLLNGYLNEEVYMKNPLGFEIFEYLDHMCKLDRAFVWV